MEKQKIKYQSWSKEEMALLAHLMGVAFNAGKNQSEAAEFASTKLGRSKLACLGQFQAKMRNKPLSIWSLLPEPGELDTPIEQESDTDIDREPNYEEKPSFVDDLMQKMRNPGGYISMFTDPKVPKITVHSGEEQMAAEILVNTADVIVVKAKGLIITIEL